MDKIIPKLYREYGYYVNSFRAFPLDIDGLKPVERRVLLTSFLVARDKFVKSARIDGTCIARFHPHGSCYGTIVQLVRQGFLEGQGNFGTDVGVEPVGAAAPRYTEAKIAKETIDLAFKYINNVGWETNELNEKEPIYLPTMLPFCLIGTQYTQGIGFGFKTFIPTYDIKDLYKRLLWLLGDRKTKPTISPISDCTITAQNNSLEELLTTGKSLIDVEGIIEVEPRTSKVVLKSWPPGRRFETILNKFNKELENQDIGFTDSSTTETKIVFQVLKQRNRDKIFQDFIEKLKETLSGKISFENIVVNQCRDVKLKSIDNMLLDTFNTYKDVNLSFLKTELEKTKKLITEYLVLEKIRPFLSSILNKKKIDYDKSIKEISSKSNTKVEIVKELFSKYRINKLLTIDTDTNSLQIQEKEIQTNMKNLQQFVLDQYNNVIKGV